MSFFKNVFTLGRYGKMHNELTVFENRRNTFLELAKEFRNSLKDQKLAFEVLKNQRKSAEKNIFLFKSILFLIKNKIKDNKSETIEDKMKIKEEIYVPTKVTSTNTSIPEIDLSKFSSDFFSTTNRNLKKLSKLKDPKKEDFILAGVDTAISAVTNAIGGIIELNKQVNEKRREIQESTKLLLNAAESIFDYHPILYKETLRANEIALTLLKSNEAFSAKYQEIFQEIFHESKITLFKKFLLKEKFQISDETIEKIVFLGSICSEYNKISQSKL